jgi:hypothetical protein
MSRARQAHRLAAIGAATPTLWLPPLAAKERQLSGATLESDVALARQLSPDLSATALDADAAAYKIGAAGINPARPICRSFFVAERELRTIELEILKLKVEQREKYAELERMAGGSL